MAKSFLNEVDAVAPFITRYKTILLNVTPRYLEVRFLRLVYTSGAAFIC